MTPFFSLKKVPFNYLLLLVLWASVISFIYCFQDNRQLKNASYKLSLFYVASLIS